MSDVEQHPFSPFLPEEARVLLLGSFPPPNNRWCMPFFYPNWTNDFWRICGLIFFDDRNHFCLLSQKRFDQDRIEAFCREAGIALFDTAASIRRLKGNASDAFLEVVSPVDIPALLRQIPLCRTMAATGEKAASTLVSGHGGTLPPVGGSTRLTMDPRPMTLFRMPSTSRAYPLPLEEKARPYRELFLSAGLPVPRAPQSVTIRKALPEDLPLIQGMADIVFRETYAPILSPSQMEYMMDWMYSLPNLRQQLSEGHTYYLAFADGIPVGYVSVQHDLFSPSEGLDIYHLHKIYVLPGHQKEGIGDRLFDQAITHILAAQRLSGRPARMELNVNRNNPALTFYQRRGMRILRSGDFPIGNGFYMNDFIMGLDLPAPTPSPILRENG